MSENEHAAAIRNIAQHLERTPSSRSLVHHADALAAQLAEAEARTARWKRVGLAYLHDPQEYEAAWQDLIDCADVPDEEAGR